MSDIDVLTMAFRKATRKIRHAIIEGKVTEEEFRRIRVQQDAAFHRRFHAIINRIGLRSYLETEGMM